MKTFAKLLAGAVLSVSIFGAGTAAQAQFFPGPMPVPAQPGPYLPGAGLLPQDGVIVAEIARNCGGNPMCMAGAWTRVEIQRCRNGFGVPGGCFGPNGEIMKVINGVVPQHLQPNVIINNAYKDITQGPGENNDLVGRKGWLRQRLGF